MSAGPLSALLIADASMPIGGVAGGGVRGCPVWCPSVWRGVGCRIRRGQRGRWWVSPRWPVRVPGGGASNEAATRAGGPDGRSPVRARVGASRTEGDRGDMFGAENDHTVTLDARPAAGREHRRPPGPLSAGPAGLRRPRYVPHHRAPATTTTSRPTHRPRCPRCVRHHRAPAPITWGRPIRRLRRLVGCVTTGHQLRPPRAGSFTVLAAPVSCATIRGQHRMNVPLSRALAPPHQKHETRQADPREQRRPTGPLLRKVCRAATAARHRSGDAGPTTTRGCG
ncbi:hypothetical protein F4561_006092 [Lipingzhangella halophila]|uniref:Uncharacterized protein n=1 Tax=Lipingzhangella halophila TaxID=1783352 RepID=A0A7W7RPE4_9ACTN|nr:hypothetical protein [Lipingzhangella halophila]